MSVTVLSSKLRRAAHGRHRCYWCGRPIPARAPLYRDERIAWDGTARTFRYHEACNSLAYKAAAYAALDEGDDWSPAALSELVAEYQADRGQPVTGWPDIETKEH